MSQIKCGAFGWWLCGWKAQVSPDYNDPAAYPMQTVSPTGGTVAFTYDPIAAVKWCRDGKIDEATMTVIK